MPTPTYTPIASTTLTGTQSSVSFDLTSVQNYRDVILVSSVLGNGGNTAPYIRINGLTTSIYNNVYASGNGTAASSVAQTGITWLDRTPSSGSTTTPVQGQVHFFDYSVTDKHKSWLSRANRSDASTGMNAGRVATTSAITTILIYAGGANNFAAGSTFSLYGVIA